MLFDVRTYNCKPGFIARHLALYKEKGLAPQSRILGAPFAFMTTETGDVNQYVHIWLYQAAADRERRRTALWADPEWLAYVAESGKLGALEKQENRLMKPTDFCMPGR